MSGPGPHADTLPPCYMTDEIRSRAFVEYLCREALGLLCHDVRLERFSFEQYLVRVIDACCNVWNPSNKVLMDLKLEVICT